MTDNNDMPDKIWVLRGDSISPPNWSVIPFGCSEPYHHDRIVKSLEAKVKELQQCVVEQNECMNGVRCYDTTFIKWGPLIKESKEALE